MKYSKSKLAIDVAKEIGKDTLHASKTIGYGTAHALKNYGKFCYDLYLGDWNSKGSFSDLPAERFFSLLAHAAGAPTLVLFYLITNNQEAANYFAPLLVPAVVEPMLKQGVREAYNVGKKYVKSKIEKVQIRL